MFTKLMLGIAQPQRQIRGMRRLRRLGVRTPACLNTWRIRTRNRRPIIELELEYAPGHSAWELISGKGVDQLPNREALVRSARSVGSVVAKLGNGRIFHRDLKPSNVVIDTTDENHPIIWMIDTVGIRVMRRRIVEIERMLERLAIQPIQLEPDLARAIRTAVLRSALRPLTPNDRRAVLARLRART